MWAWRAGVGSLNEAGRAVLRPLWKCCAAGDAPCAAGLPQAPQTPPPTSTVEVRRGWAGGAGWGVGWGAGGRVPAHAHNPVPLNYNFFLDYL